MIEGFLRHVRTCNTARLPGSRTPLRLNGHRVGWTRPEDAPAAGGGLENQDDWRRFVAGLLDRGRFELRHEPFDVRAVQEGPILARVDRGAIPVLGLLAQGAHVNGLVRRSDGVHVWMGRRARDKKIEPGKLDQMVGGGIAAGDDAWSTLIKESGEEASLSASLAGEARPMGHIDYAMEWDGGLRRDRIHCFDLWLPEDFRPVPSDGEVESFHLHPIEHVMRLVAETDEVKFNVNLVLIDLFLRLDLFPSAEAAVLRQALRAGPTS